MDQMVCWWYGPLQVQSPVDLHPFLAELSNPRLLCFSSCTGFPSQSHNWGHPLPGLAHSQVSEAARMILSTSCPPSSLIARRSFTAGNHSSLSFLQSFHKLSVKITSTLPCVLAWGRIQCLPVCGSWSSTQSALTCVYCTEGTLVCIHRIDMLQILQQRPLHVVSSCVWFFLSTANYVISHTYIRDAHISKVCNAHCIHPSLI